MMRTIGPFWFQHSAWYLLVCTEDADFWGQASQSDNASHRDFSPIAKYHRAQMMLHPICRLALENARSEKLILLQHNKLISVQPNELVFAWHKRLDGDPTNCRSSVKADFRTCSKVILTRVPVAAARRCHVFVDGSVRPLSSRAITDWVVFIRLANSSCVRPALARA